ncbi:LysR family transcriptional regulator [Nesterenkonia sp. NBAIMH1]|uniref:LysR family transcriptional regulator n=1 Tax=Nesterenkonia sp. NBAIMH1 TaxID=2600320 RepID=UPI00143D034D|nr:LysR family transcriptional regulator [Nesterenkonia sp. NBAIMH1]
MPSFDPDVGRLRTFLAVVAEESISAAADNLRISRAAASQQMQALQRETGLTLLERRGRGIAVTAAGRQLSVRAERLLREAGKLQGLAADLQQGRTGSLLISHFVSVGVAWIPALVAAISSEFPELRITMRLWDLEEAAAWEPDAEIFVRHPDVADRAGYRTTELMQDSYAAVLPAGHRLAGRERIGLEDLRGEVWVDNDYTRGPNRKILMQACAGVGLAPDFRIETQDYAAAVACVEAGVGITVMPQLSWQTVAGMVSGVQALPLDEPGLHRVLAVRTKEASDSAPAVRRLLELLQARVSQQP